MAIAKIQKGDQVKVISGAFKGTVGTVTKIVNKIRPGKSVQKRASVSTLPQIVNYRRNNRAFNLPGEKNSANRLIDVSNLSLITDDKTLSKVKIEDKNGKKIRVYKKNQKQVIKHESLESTKAKPTKEVETSSGNNEAKPEAKKRVAKKTEKSDK